MSREIRDEARLAWALVEESLVAPGAALCGSVREAATPLQARNGRLLPPLSGTGGDSYRLASLASYSGIPPARRPPAFCPICRERVWMKLGPRRRYHYAHALEDSNCAATRAEGALHLAAKLHVAKVLRGLSSLPINRLCNRTPVDRRDPCRATEPSDWVSGWDHIEVEYAIPSIRADIMLLAAGRTVGAIEILASHAVDEPKAGRYRDLGVPWIEVPAERVTDLWRPHWDGGGPLPVVADSEEGEWRCPRHRRLFEAWLDHERNGVHRLAGRFVHIYRMDEGLAASTLRSERIPLVVHEQRRDGECVEAWPVREDTESGLGEPVRGTDREEALRRLHDAFVAWVRWTRASRGAVVDSPMRWIAARALPDRDLDRVFPERARWDPHTAAFILPPNAPSIAWPVVDEHGGAEWLTGAPECFWTALPERDRPAMAHALVGVLWMTLRVEEWRSGEGMLGRALLHLYRHDGREWREMEGMPVAIERQAEFRWDEAFPALARMLAVHDAATPATVEEALIGIELGGQGPVQARTEDA